MTILAQKASEAKNVEISLKRNIFANTISQMYVTIVGIIIVPWYIKFMGVEAYGLVGFFAMLQAWFNLLDMGLTPTIARETARFCGGSTDVLGYRRLIRALEVVFLFVAATGAVAIFSASGYIASDWLQASQLPLSEVNSAIKLMALIVALRWICGLYRGAITGSEQLVWLGNYNSLVATVRFVGVLAVLKYVGTTPTIFFRYQLGVALIELTCLMSKVYLLLPQTSSVERLPWSWAPLRAVLKFSGTIGFISIIWVFVTQTDKLLLSKILPLSEYGYFTLAVLVASGVMMIGGPISGAILPRLAKLDAQGDHAGLIGIYRQATQLVAVVSGAVAITLAFSAEPLLWAWTGDQVLAREAAPTLILYALGNGILAVSAFPYYLQYAKGNLRLHLIGQFGFIALLIPSLIMAAVEYGGVGAGYAWLTVNVIYFISWVPVVHSKFEPGLNMKWYFKDTLLIFLATAIMGYVLNALLPQIDSRLMQGAMVIGFGLLLLLTGGSVSSVVRLNTRNLCRSI